MRILTLSSSPLSDKSFRIGLGVVVIFAAAEILSAAYYYISRIHLTQAQVLPRVVHAFGDDIEHWFDIAR